jgi:hypothetical protein
MKIKADINDTFNGVRVDIFIDKDIKSVPDYTVELTTYSVWTALEILLTKKQQMIALERSATHRVSKKRLDAFLSHIKSNESTAEVLAKAKS